MVDLAASMGRDGRCEEALKELDDVQSWFSWTDAAGRVEAERKIIRTKIAARDEQAEWARRSEQANREYRADQVRQESFEHLLELQKAQAANQPSRPLVPASRN
jgi:hypothetical protein